MGVRSIVLLGMGHTHLHVLKMWGRSPIRNTRLICISDFLYSVYSGMLPGVLAGNYRTVAAQIDWPTIADRCGAHWSPHKVIGHEPLLRQLAFKDRKPLKYDVLSVGIGSVPQANVYLEPLAPVIPIKPMQTFLRRLGDRVEELRKTARQRKLRIVVIGGGAGGVEITFCAPWFVQDVLKTGNRFGFNKSRPSPFTLLKPTRSFLDVPQDSLWTLIQGEQEILPSDSAGLRRRVLRELQQRSVDVRCGSAAKRVTAETVILKNAETIPADIVLWCTRATASGLLQQLNLPTDERGFLLTDSSLKTTADAPVFAVGDAGTMRGQPLPKAAVIAIREGPVLWQNIQRLLAGKPLQEYHPQREVLKLLNTGRGRAIGEYRGLSFEGLWAWRLKDRLDRRFVEQYQELQHVLPSVSSPTAESVLR